MQIYWKEMSKEKPEDGQWCLTEMKHGFISGFWDTDKDCFHGYYSTQMEWTAHRWVDVIEFMGNKE